MSLIPEGDLIPSMVHGI